MNKRIDPIRSLSLTVISLVSLTFSLSNMIGAVLPPVVSAVSGIIDLCTPPLPVYSSINKIKK